MDFTLTLYQQLLEALIAKNYQFLTVEEYFSDNHSVSPSKNLPLVLLRHDVDRKPENSLKMARLESELGIKATYYFRTIPQTLKPDIIKKIAELGHEIGYHYENLTTANS
jgi:peptidoglycan/xylan/chitin deacetylase (PgdA/CDA1 family)